MAVARQNLPLPHVYLKKLVKTVSTNHVDTTPQMKKVKLLAIKAIKLESCKTQQVAYQTVRDL